MSARLQRPFFAHPWGFLELEDVTLMSVMSAPPKGWCGHCGHFIFKVSKPGTLVISGCADIADVADIVFQVPEEVITHETADTSFSTPGMF
jgi:hypothetical protein